MSVNRLLLAKVVQIPGRTLDQGDVPGRYHERRRFDRFQLVHRSLLPGRRLPAPARLLLSSVRRCQLPRSLLFCRAVVRRLTRPRGVPFGRRVAAVLRCGVRLRLAARWVESVFFKGAQRYPTAGEMAIEKRVDKDTVAPTH